MSALVTVLLVALPVSSGLSAAAPPPPVSEAPPPKVLDAKSDPVRAQEQSKASRAESDACWAALKGARGMSHVLCALRETTAVAEAQLAGLGIEPNRWWRNMGHVSRISILCGSDHGANVRVVSSHRMTGQPGSGGDRVAAR